MQSVAQRKGHRVPDDLVTALVYTRVSSDEQAREGVSLDAQLAECRRYAAQKGWMLGTEYQDVLAGTRDDRPQYQALLADVRRLRAEGRSAAVVVARLDRFGRRVLERVRCREELKRLGVPTHSVREGGEVSDLVANILASVAEEEVRQLGERVSLALAHIRGGGWRVAGRAPFGYRWRDATDPERKMGAPKSVLVIDQTAAPFAREMFQRIADGASIRSVARWLAGLPEDVRQGRAFSVSATQQALRAAVYIGRNAAVGQPPAATGAVDRPRGNWPALISDEVFARVQARMDGHRRIPHQASGRYLLTGLLRCPSCGCRMRGSRRVGPGKPRYTCSASLGGAAVRDLTCRYEGLVIPLDAAVLDQVGALVDGATVRVPEMQRALRRAWGALSRPADDSTAVARTYQAAATKARERIKRLALLFADGDLDRAGYELGRAQAQVDLEAAEAALERLHVTKPAAPMPTFEEAISRAGGWRDALTSGNMDRRRDVLAVLVDRIIPERIGFGKYAARITWTETGEHLHALVAAANGAEQAA